MTRKLEYLIQDEFNNTSISHFLKANDFCHQTIVYLKQTQNGICVNGRWEHVNTLLHSGDQLVLQWEEPVKETSVEAIYAPLDIVYEDEDYLIVNKAANTPIHPSMGNHDNTLANAVLFYYQAKQLKLPYRCINRLDRDTTGLTIIAKNCQAAGILSRQVSERLIHRTYLAIVEGQITENGTINAAIARKDDSTIERCIDMQRGETAITHYFPLAYDPIHHISLVKLVLETGRTHQIRVHMKHIGHPLIGDFLYNPNMTLINRQALHAFQLSFLHPITREPVSYCAPLPDDMKQLFSNFEIV